MEIKKIFLSPSNQTANVGAYPGTNEHEQCQLIAEAATEYLESNYKCEVIIPAVQDNMKTRAEYANAIGADIYLAIHTNAFSDNTVHGTETYYYSSDAKGKAFAEALLNAVGDITGTKRRCIANDSLIELNTPVCTRAYIEVEFHSNPEKAVWITENVTLIGQTIGECIAKQIDLESADDDTPPETPDKDCPEITERDEQWVIENIDFVLDCIAKNIKSADTDEPKYYRVQVGAYSSEQNAKTMVQKLKEAGFNGIIKYY